MMNKIANVVYAYTAKNDDELELQVGDKIEVIGVEEEGWLKGKLKGRVGVFPENFVVIETNTTGTTTTNNNNNHNHNNNNNINNNNITSTTNKLTNIFGSKASKNSLSSNSLNSNNSNSSINNHNNNNLIMNNTQQTDNSNLVFNDDASSITSGDKRPKPIRAVGYGDIFAVGATKPKLLPADGISTTATTTTATPFSGISTSERLNSIGSIVSNTLQKQIPKKPPPPTPKTDSDQAPALPPKPVNQFSPLLQQQLSRSLTQQQQQPHHQNTNTQQVREQAKVIYAYEPSNEDELAMEVGDIIDIIDKEIEDVGWWKGELRGKIGVFPDNFVELIKTTELPTPTSFDRLNNRSNTTTSSQQPIAANNFNQHNIIENRINNKPVFASSLKDFSKELENNLIEKQQHNIGSNNSAAALLSAKRNKLQQLTSLTGGSLEPPSHMTSSSSDNGVRDNPSLDHSSSLSNSSLSTSPSKLNHITVNRAKGPSRKPPTKVLSKKTNQLSTLQNELLSSNGTSVEEHFHGSLPIDSSSAASNKTRERPQSVIATETTSYLPVVQQQQVLLSNSSTITTNPYLQSSSAKSNLATPAAIITDQLTTNKQPTPATMENVSENQTILPKTSQRLGQQPPMVNNPLPPIDKIKTTSSTTTQSIPATPSWMLELKKAHAEKKRDSPAFANSVPSNISTNIISATTTSTTTTNSINTTSIAPPPQVFEVIEKPVCSVPVSEKKTTTTSNPTLHNENLQATANSLSSAQYDNLLKQISKNVSKEINELRGEVTRLKEDFIALGDLKSVLDTMRTELKACQNATENQKRYIKDLVNNLVEERKKIVSMQKEIDRNLK